MEVTLFNSTFTELKTYYDTILNKDKSTYKSSNDEPTPIDCIVDMLNPIPETFWQKKNLRILDPCCGNGNFHIPTYFKLNTYHTTQHILENQIYFNDVNESRLDNVKKVFGNNDFKLNITQQDFLTGQFEGKFDLILANPPYAKLLPNGKRASKNHNLIKDFLERTLSLLNEGGYLIYITPDNWMSFADRNLLIKRLTELQFIHLDIHSAKKYFKKIGSSFTWYVIQNKPADKPFKVTGIWKKKVYEDLVESQVRNYIPLYYNKTIQSILSKTIDDKTCEKFKVLTSSDLHHYTKKSFIRSKSDSDFKYRLIHTPTQTCYASRPHKFQEGWKVFISTTDKYGVFVDDCGMTQSIVFIRCNSKEEAQNFMNILTHPLYQFINNICRWGNFNNIRILQSFPQPKIQYGLNEEEIWNYFQISPEEQKFIKDYL